MGESYVVKKLLRAVPSKFLQIASTIEQFGKLEEMSIEEVIGSLKVHGERLRGQAYRHFVAECRKPHRGREVRRDVQKEVNLSQIQVDEAALLIAEIGKRMAKTMLLKKETVVPKLRLSANEQQDLQVWYLDNGASNHMAGQRGKLKTMDERLAGDVKFGDGSMVSSKGKGTVAFKCKNGEEKMLREVYYIPSLCKNIISLGQLSGDGHRVIISVITCGCMMKKRDC
ncbi:uncharacterized protein LOC141666381 [Apium graveolens]|uniref:uncharacterized protein LOC141666381 n=1 Tax=Apium graveolens TaxID=4045 RepID=UPI003D7BEC53